MVVQRARLNSDSAAGTMDAADTLTYHTFESIVGLGLGSTSFVDTCRTRMYHIKMHVSVF